ncbi:fungal Zn binuclear cluster domain-containing protein [Colletotrichum scovillei]|uniref:Fungal Zn binuclear cluster domain-containing protein n=1 Tax=Colletotrichum scovillei TaxID=1209932 RepID=A0A9P7RE15_9PEZI|nr:fungal Zn binuclear cluster domain-containing protein [Colletotrichum scovillei]KAG7073893.1 fungal Zn binuclear cluster domain-containing protein [Colletotrichum scovillei]KAG7081038.1 fungal Zn binuclear cluster domain-containing protein [Colletotrichum scovillei]
MKRLGYRKSRNGCLRCKERRVKCDENKPCSACVRHGLPCSLENAGAPTSASSHSMAHLPPPGQRTKRSGSRGSASALRRRSSAQSPASLSPQSAAGSLGGQQSASSSGGGGQTSPSSQSDPFPYFSRFLTDLNKTETASGWISDLELMHHYTSVSYRTFSHSSLAQKTLQYDVPREALSYPFLLHQILAFSAYHLAYLQPDCRHAYLMQAAQHQNDAINGMRGTLLGTISSTNCHALFASSIFLTLSAFATYPSYEKYNPSFSPIDSMLDIFTLTDGMSMILRASDDDLRKGPLREIFIRGSGDTTPSTVEATLQPLFERLPRLSSRLAEIGLVEHEGKYAITNAVIALSECIAKVSTFNAMSAPVEFRAVFLWPILMTSDYLDMLRRRHPAAMVVLAHYCVIVHMAEPFCWFLNGWARSLVSLISQHLAATPWADLMAWPVEIIGVGGYEVQLDRMAHAMPAVL